MATVIAIAQRKGGAGKTTLSCQLTAAFLELGLDVAAIDCDEQGSFETWATQRASRLGRLDFSFTTASGVSLSQAVRRARERADIIIIDTAPKVDREVGRAIALCDMVVSPLQLSPLDLAASIPTAQMIGAAEKPALFVVNRAPPRARIAERIRAKIAECELPVATVELGNRAAFAESLATGQGVVETERNGPAAAEIRQLREEIMAAMEEVWRAA